MRDWKTLFSAVAAALVLAACSTAAQPSATMTAEVVPSATQVQATVTQAASATAVSTATEVVQENYCLTCHTDKNQLISTAKLEEAAPKESEGAG